MHPPWSVLLLSIFDATQRKTPTCTNSSFRCDQSYRGSINSNVSSQPKTMWSLVLHRGSEHARFHCNKSPVITQHVAFLHRPKRCGQSQNVAFTLVPDQRKRPKCYDQSQNATFTLVADPLVRHTIAFFL